MADVAAHEDRVGKIMLAAKHLDTQNYHGKAETRAIATQTEERYKKLNQDLLDRRKELMESTKLHEFLEEARKTLEVIVTTHTASSSQDYGADASQTDKFLKKASSPTHPLLLILASSLTE